MNMRTAKIFHGNNPDLFTQTSVFHSANMLGALCAAMLIHDKKFSSIRHPEIIDKSKHCSAFRVRGHDFTQVNIYRISL